MPEQERQTAVTLGIMRDIITEVMVLWYGMVVIDFPVLETRSRGVV